MLTVFADGGFFCAVGCVSAQQNAPLTTVPPKKATSLLMISNFRTANRTRVRLHYTTIGTPQRDAGGRVTNAVLILHGTNRAGRRCS